MKKVVILVATILSLNGAFAKEMPIKKYKYNSLDVVYLEDNKLPTYSLEIYFSDGALSEEAKRAGETQMMFDLLERGTTKYDQAKISDLFDFYGVSIGSQVTHEYSMFSFEGLAKDIDPTLKMVCHLFRDATFPKEEIKKYQTLQTNKFKNLVSNHSSLAERVFRKLSLGDSPYGTYVEGTIKTIATIDQEHLKQRLNYFNDGVKKRVYITGPSRILSNLKEIMTADCGWGKSSQSFTQAPPTEQENLKKNQPTYYLLPVPEANQAQIRVGRYITANEVVNNPLNNYEYIQLISEFIGGGFTSKLMQELRVKRGLTYTAGATISIQKNYGRSVISTFTKNQTLVETIKVMKETIEGVANGKFSDEELKMIVQNVSGGNSFKFERNKSFLHNICYFDHIGKPYEDLYQFVEKVQKIKKSDVTDIVSQYLNWSNEIILVVGDKSLEKDLKKLGEVKLLKVGDFL